MRGIPDKIATKQDLFNICNDLHHAEAKVFLKNMAPEELKRLGVTRNDIKQIKVDLANRKRKETIENRELSRLKDRLYDVQRRLAAKKAEFEAKTRDLKEFIAGRDLIGPKTEELHQLQADLNRVREMPDQERGLSNVLRNLNAILLEMKCLEPTCDSDELKQIQEVSGFVLTKTSEISMIRNYLAQERIIRQHKKHIIAKVSEIQEMTGQIKQLNEWAESIELTEKELQLHVQEMQKLEAQETELLKTLKEV